MKVEHEDREALMRTIHLAIDEMDARNEHEPIALLVNPSQVRIYADILSTTDYADGHVFPDRTCRLNQVKVGRYAWWADTMKSGELD